MTAIKVSGGNYDEMMRVLQVELHDDATDRLAEMGRLLEQMRAGAPSDSALAALRRLAHNMKGIGGSFGYRRLITFTCLPKRKTEKKPIPNFPMGLIPRLSRPGNSS